MEVTFYAKWYKICRSKHLFNRLIVLEMFKNFVHWFIQIIKVLVINNNQKKPNPLTYTTVSTKQFISGPIINSSYLLFITVLTCSHVLYFELKLRDLVIWDMLKNFEESLNKNLTVYLKNFWSKTMSRRCLMKIRRHWEKY